MCIYIYIYIIHICLAAHAAHEVRIALLGFLLIKYIIVYKLVINMLLYYCN